MKRPLKGYLIVALAAVLMVTAGVMSADFKFVEQGDVFDLSELLDGETRVFGSGEKQLSATRSGDAVTLIRDAHGESDELSIVCLVGQDTCEVITSRNDENIMVKIEKTRECEGPDCDEATIDITALTDDLPEGAHVMIRKTIRCEDTGNGEECEDFEWTSNGADLGEGTNVFIHEGSVGEGLHAEGHAKGHANMVFVGDGQAPVMIKRMHGDGRLLRCPEGDATLTVKADEADQTFLCPRHSVAMEDVSGRHAKHKTVIKKRDRKGN